MYRTYPVNYTTPNVLFAHGDIALFNLYKDTVLMNSVELRVKDLTNGEELPDDGRYKLYLKDGELMVDDRAWPVSRHQHDDMQYQFVKVLGNVHTPFYKAQQRDF